MKEILPEQLRSLAKQIMDMCPECLGLRYLTSGQQCACVYQYIIAVRQVESNIPENFRKMSMIDTVDEEFKHNNTNGFRNLLCYLNKLDQALQDGGSLYLYGSEGAGTSFLGVQILKQAIEDEFSTYFMLSGELWRLTSEALTNDELRTQMSQMMTTKDFLLIDDIDQMFINRAESPLVTLLHSFLKMRFYANKPIIFTASSPRDMLDPTVGRFVSVYGEKMAEIELDANHKPKLRESWARKFFNGTE